MQSEYKELAVHELRAAVEPELLPFDSTASLDSPGERIVGQERAIDAIKFGMGMKRPGYNIFIAGPAKAGLTYMAKTYVEEQARTGETPPDWCYVYNFKEKDKPKSLSLKAGMGRQLKKDVEEFIKILREKIPEVFSSEDYAAKDKEIHEGFERKKQELIDQLSAEARQKGFILQVGPMGMMSVPASATGEPMSQEDVALLSPEQMQELRNKSTLLHESMQQTMKAIQKEEEEFKERHKKLEHEVALFIVGQIMANLSEKYEEEPQVLEYFGAMREDILENLEDLKPKQHEAAQQQHMAQMQQQGMAMPMPQQDLAFRKYEVNVLIDNSETKGAPVVIESNPSYPNLFGSIEKQAWFGALMTDHTMIKPGAVHRANGGYLVMKALDLLRTGISYEAMQRMLLDREIKIEDIGELYGMLSTRSLKPEPIPLNLKIILTGDSHIYGLLYTHDDRFRKHFKVKAHLDNEMDRKDESVLDYARMMSRYCKEQELRQLDRSGVARAIEYAMERTDDQDKLTLEIGNITDLLMEADYLAGLDGAELIGKKHVEEAIEKRIYRSNLYEERMQEVVKKDIMWVETDGYKIGQVNGLTVLMTGDHEFGQPKRITATVAVGREGTVSIDRESKMSGNIHTKGLLTLGGFLKERFARNKPISLTASLAFEQSYGMVDGDSASSTELYALLSAISRTPIYQGIAVTGSVSQKGEIQPIGGVNQKIKGFFDICKHKGLNGKQGVIIPSKNVKNLMLHHEVVDAVKEGMFHIWPVSAIEEGIEILTGMKAGKLREEDNTYPEDTLFRKVDDRLTQLSEIVQKYGKDTENAKSREEEPAACPHCGG
jgi:lon-related putative ATP-dependent protease